MTRSSVLVTSSLLASACASSSNVIDRSSLSVSDNSKIVAANVIPSSEKFPRVVDHLGLAQEVYQAQLTSLKQRKVTLRARNRTFQALSYGTFAVTTLGVGIAAIASREQDDGTTLEAAGYGAIGGAAAGTIFQFAGYMQEDPNAVDAKIRRLETAYLGMLDRVRMLAEQPSEETARVTAAMSSAIEGFIGEAMEIDVKG